MIKLPFKVEAKGSLWEVLIERGSYSDHEEWHYIFSGNSLEEAWEFVKIWAKAGGLGEYPGNSVMWMLFLDDKGRQIEKFNLKDGDMLYDNLCVHITRANVIYVNPKATK